MLEKLSILYLKLYFKLIFNMTQIKVFSILSTQKIQKLGILLQCEYLKIIQNPLLIQGCYLYIFYLVACAIGQ